MRWEHMTAPEFAKGVGKARGVCVLPLGVLEKHGEHLPLGTDLFFARRVAREAARREPAIVFPPYFFTQIHEAKHERGAVAVSGRMMMDLLAETCSEIARNGLRKIILYNGHGGNNSFLPFFGQLALERPRDYAVYLPGWGSDPEIDRKLKGKLQDKYDGHAGEGETSLMMALYPQDVRLKADIPARGRPWPGLPKLKGTQNAIWWYSLHPHHYAGQARLGTVEKGRLMFEGSVRHLAGVIKAVKADTAVARLTRSFFSRVRH